MQVCFDSNNSLTHSKITIVKIRYSQNAQNSVRSTNFYPKQATAKTSFVLHSTYTGDTPCQVWFDFDNSLTQSKRTILKILYSRNSKSSVLTSYEILTFSWASYSRIVFVLHSTYTGDTPHLVWFDWNNSLTR